MNFLLIFRVAFRALARNKMRSALTMLGIIIGVAAVIAMVSVGQGAQASIQEQISSMGTNMLMIGPGSMNMGGVRSGTGATSRNTLTADDVEAIKAECAGVALATPVVRTNAQIIFGNQNWNTSIQGYNESLPQIRKWPIKRDGDDGGEFFTEGDVRTAARVAVIGQTIADNLFPGLSPIGQTMRIRELSFRVVGVMSKRGQDSGGRDQDDVIFVPYTTLQKKLRSITYIDSAYVSAVSPEATYTAQEQITELLRQRHKLSGSDENDFWVRNMTDVAETADETNRIMTILLASVASVSLVVGGIGIMNIMLVSVTERTREIGIRMAIGARSSDVRTQFLIESIVLSVTGGALGIVLGTSFSLLIPRLVGWPTLISTISIVGSVLFSAAVGIFFGYYPARKAAGLDPIEALRYE